MAHFAYDFERYSGHGKELHRDYFPYNCPLHNGNVYSVYHDAAPAEQFSPRLGGNPRALSSVVGQLTLSWYVVESA